MAKFECSMCGRCCINFGRYITIEKQLEGGRFSCHSRLDGEHFVAQVIENRSDSPLGVERTYPCPFLRKERGSEQYLCIIYPTRPSFCREFKCSRMDIFNPGGERVGRIGGKKSLLSKDRGLVELWNREIVPLPNIDDRLWSSKVQSMLVGAGYKVVIYE